MKIETQSPKDESPEPRSAPTPTQVTSPPVPIHPATGCMAEGIGVMFFLGAPIMLWTAVSALIHSEWREAAELLGMTALMLVGARVFWLAGRGHNVDIFSGENLDIQAVESDAMLQTLERYDRQIAEAQTGDSARAGGTPDPAFLPDPVRDGRFHEPIHRGDEARIAARMKERGDPG